VDSHREVVSEFESLINDEPSVLLASLVGYTFRHNPNTSRTNADGVAKLVDFVEVFKRGTNELEVRTTRVEFLKNLRPKPDSKRVPRILELRRNREEDAEIIIEVRRLENPGRFELDQASPREKKVDETLNLRSLEKGLPTRENNEVT
jgi:hypothetical protein